MTTYLGPQIVKLGKKTPIPKARKTDLPDDVLPLLGIDPGGTTGWSLLVLRKDFRNEDIFSQKLQRILAYKISWQHGQIDCSDIDSGAYQLRRLMDDWPTAAIVWESFFVRQMAVDLTPVKLEAIVGHHLWFHGRQLHYQQPAMAKRLNNERLKLENVYTKEGGLDHARDADRHVLMMVRRCMENKGWKERLWPQVYEN